MFNGVDYGTGWDQWLYPIKQPKISVTVKEDSAGAFGSPDRFDTFLLPAGVYYATNVDHSAAGLPGRGLYHEFEQRINASGTLQNTYALSVDQPAEYSGAHSLKIERTAGTDDFQIDVSGQLHAGWFGQSWSTFDDGGTGVIDGQVSRFGDWTTSAASAADQRAFPTRRVGRSRPDTADGNLQDNGEWSRRSFAYRQVAGVEVWPSRTNASAANPLYSTEAFTYSDVFDAPINDPNAAFRHLFRHGSLSRDVLVCTGQATPTLSPTSGTWERLRLQFPARIKDAIQDTKPAEQYDIRFSALVQDGNRNH